MKYTVAAKRIYDAGRGMIEETIYEDHGLSEKEAKKAAKRLATDKDYHVYVSFYRPEDGQYGYLNRDGHAITGERW